MEDEGLGNLERFTENQIESESITITSRQMFERKAKGS